MNIKLEAENLCRSLFSRMAWEYQCKPLLQMNDIKLSLGTERTLEKLISSFESVEVANSFVQQYKPYYEQVLLCGNRTLKVFQLNEEHFNQIKSVCTDVDIFKGVDTDFFPYYIDTDRIQELDIIPKLTNIKFDTDDEGNEKVYFYFSTNRSITEKHDLNASVFEDNQAIVDFLENYSKVTAYTDKFRQYIDIVCLNEKDHTIEIRLDTSSAVAKKDIDLLFTQIEEAFISSIPKKIKFSIFKQQINFFPWIQGLYADTNCRVVELSFTTDDGYIHNERERSSTKNGDVRNGEFHMGGAEKCDINPYRISARWKGNFSTEIEYEYEMSLNSNVRELSNPTQRALYHAIISQCPSEKDLDSLLAILKKKNEKTATN
ncbi:hypothetical protein [Proteus vulgaris]|uniref:hypothetical protein n=1 Tax=Proteus vulgaris TaxID=585 RepID=UPI00288C15C0|nr:hypothetical protein [Proteus vulgaris]